MRFEKHHHHRPQDDDFLDTRINRHGRRHGGRVFGHGDLKLFLLSRIAGQPMHGYELIRDIEALCGGTYSPSPGTVYPSLALLEDQGLIHSVQAADGSSKKQYAITDEGLQAVAAEAETIAIIGDRLKLMASNAASERPPFPVRRAIHQLKHALMRPEGAWNEAETTRVRAIIERAAIDIARGA